MILDLVGEVQSIWDLWTSDLQECKGNFFFQSLEGQVVIFGRVQKIFTRKLCGVAQPEFGSPYKFLGGTLTSTLANLR
jgi:hypothetical protein